MPPPSVAAAAKRRSCLRDRRRRGLACLATWDDALYAFTGLGEVRRIDGADGSTTLLATSSEPWLGAASRP